MTSRTGGTGKRGFAAMDAAQRRDLAAKGGRSVPPEKRSFSQDPALAAKAGRKGGGHAHAGPRPGREPAGDE
ncbi:MAG TPA: KGG domain-containing protein [Roseomonas sp.]|jgi:general stress protein YciG